MQAQVAAERHFPIGYDGTPYSYLTRLLPYLDQKPLYDAMNFWTIDGEGVINTTVRMTQLEVLLCPSSPRSGLNGSDTNYAGNQGTDRFQVEARGAELSAQDGIVTTDPGVAPRNVTDGLSATVAAAEWVTADMDKVFSTMLSPQHPNDYEPFAVACHNFNPSKDALGPNISSLGSDWIRYGLYMTTYDHILPPNDNTCWTQASPIGAATAGSRHPGGERAFRRWTCTTHKRNDFLVRLALSALATAKRSSQTPSIES